MGIPIKLCLSSALATAAIVVTFEAPRICAENYSLYKRLILLPPVLIGLSIISFMAHFVTSFTQPANRRAWPIAAHIALDLLAIAVLVLLAWLYWFQPRSGHYHN
jgi:hypothetical protein